MFDWPSHSAGGDQVGVFIECVANRDYVAAESMLTDLIDAGQLKQRHADELLEMLSQAQRLAADQQRLVEVAASLADDEEHIQLLLLAAPEAEGQVAAPNNESGGAEPDSESGSGKLDSESDSGELAVWLLGSCRISYRGRPMDLSNGDRAAAVLRFLAAETDRGVHKEQLAAVFWPDVDERAARRSLHQVIYNIRRRLVEIGADGELTFQNDRYVLGGHRRWRDIDEMERLTAEARLARSQGDTATFVAAYEQVDRLYRGDLLADHPFCEWAEMPRRHYRQLHREAVGVLLDHYENIGKRCWVVHLAERVLRLDPTDEDVGRRLMRAHVELGNPQLAADVFSTQVQFLAEEIGVEPNPESLRLARELLPSPHFNEW